MFNIKNLDVCNTSLCYLYTYIWGNRLWAMLRMDKNLLYLKPGYLTSTSVVYINGDNKKFQFTSPKYYSILYIKDGN